MWRLRPCNGGISNSHLAWACTPEVHADGETLYTAKADICAADQLAKCQPANQLLMKQGTNGCGDKQHDAQR